MTTFANQTIGSHDDKSNEYVEIWYDETYVEGFEFHSVMTRDVMGNSHMVYGMSVSARHVFAACHAFNTAPGMAILVDKKHGGKTYVCRVWLPDGSEEFRLSDKYGKPIARMRRTGYVQTQGGKDRVA